MTLSQGFVRREAVRDYARQLRARRPGLRGENDREQQGQFALPAQPVLRALLPVNSDNIKNP